MLMFSTDVSTSLCCSVLFSHISFQRKYGHPDRFPQTYLSADMWALNFWAIPTISFGINLVYQLLPSGTDILLAEPLRSPEVNSLGWRYTLLNGLIAAHITLWVGRAVSEQPIPGIQTAAVTVFTILSSSFAWWCYRIVKRQWTDRGFGENFSCRLSTYVVRSLADLGTSLVLVHIPLSIITAWLSGMVIVNLFESFGVDSRTHAPGAWTKLFVLLGLAAILSIGKGVEVICGPQGMGLTGLLWCL